MAKFITVAFNVYEDKKCKKFIRSQSELINIDAIIRVQPADNEGKETIIDLVGSSPVCNETYSEVVQKIKIACAVVK